MQLYELLNITLDRFCIQAAYLASESEMSAVNLEQFRNGSLDVSVSTLLKILDALPDDAYAYFCSQLLLERNTPQQVVQLLTSIATKIEAGEITFKPRSFEQFK